MPPKTSRKRRWLIAAAAVLILYLVVGFLVLPPLVRGQIEEKASAALGRTVTVEQVRMNPLTFSIAVEELHISDHDGGELASWKRAYANFDPLTSLFRWEWHVGDVELIEPRQRIAIDQQGRLNIADLLEGGEEAPEPAESAPLPAFGLGRLVIQDWSVSISDNSHRQPFATVIGPMAFELTGLATRPGEGSPYLLQGTTDTGETFGWSGVLTVEPPGSEGTIEFAGVSLPKHAPLSDDMHRAQVSGGTLSFSTRYALAFGDAPAIRLAETKLAIEGLALGFAGAAEPAVQLAKLEVALPSADAMARTAAVERVTLSGLRVKAERRADGSIDLLDWLPPAPEEATGRPPAPPEDEEGDAGPAPSVAVKRIEIVDGRIQITDRTTPRPAVLVVDQIEVALTNGGTDLDKEVGLEASLRWDEEGTVSVTGTVRPRPLAAALEVNLSGLELAPLDPYVEPHADVRIRDGRLNVAGKAEVAQPPGGKLSLTWAGDVSIDGWNTVDGRLGTPLAGWKSLAITDSRVTLEPMVFSAAEVALVEPLANLAINKEGTINVMAALRLESPELDEFSIDVEAAKDEAELATVPAEPPAAPPPESAPGGTAPSETAEPLPFEVRVALITISGGTFRVRDESVGTGFATELRDFGGTIKGLSNDNLARADVDLSARLDGTAPLRIAGAINPLAEDKYSDIRVEFSNIDLPIFSPYSGRYLGQTIEKGKLQVDLGYKVSQNVLEGENRVVLDQFYLGERVDSPSAVKLPLGLALALLRDRQGRIDLDVPVRGNLEDPDFRYGQVVWKAIGNIIVKAATSPFNMLGSILGGAAREEDLSYVDFASAETQPGEESARKLDLLGKALFERPGLRLEINAPPLPSGDREGLIEKRLAAMLRAEKARQLSEAAATPEAQATGERKTEMLADGSAAEAQAIAPESVTVTPAETDDLLGALFARAFPEEAERVAAPAAGVSAAAATATEAGRESEPADDERPGLLRRIVRTLVRTLFGTPDSDEPAPEERVARDEAPSPTEAEAGDAGAEQAPEPLPVAEVRARVVSTIDLDDSDFQALADARARVIRDTLLASGQVEPERVFLTTAPSIPEGAAAPSEGARVFFQLE